MHSCQNVTHRNVVRRNDVTPFPGRGLVNECYFPVVRLMFRIFFRPENLLLIALLLERTVSKSVRDSGRSTETDDAYRDAIKVVPTRNYASGNVIFGTIVVNDVFKNCDEKKKTHTLFETTKRRLRLYLYDRTDIVVCRK